MHIDDLHMMCVMCHGAVYPYMILRMMLSCVMGQYQQVMVIASCGDARSINVV